MRARDPKDISAAVKFAAKYKIPTVIKNSGHDYLGRASRRNALMIWTHFMNDTSFLNADGKWFPSGCKAGEYQENDLLVKVSAGVNLQDLYRAVSEKGRLVVAGSATTVGVTGGYIQGGGHSPLSPSKGMGSDNAVEFEVVTADVRSLPIIKGIMYDAEIAIMTGIHCESLSMRKPRLVLGLTWWRRRYLWGCN